MPGKRPGVSLYIPAYNCAHVLATCLQSVARQRPKPDEVIVVDDGSTDQTARVAERAGVRLIRHRHNRGVAAARNTALQAARNQFVASLDADLVAPRHWLATLRRNFKGRRRIAGCCGRVIEKHTGTIADRWRAVHMKLDFGMRRSYRPRWLYCGVALIRRDAILDAGGFDERCRCAYEDVDLSNRLRDRGHALLYDPQAVATHLKRSRPGDAVRGFWSYWAAKNLMEGAYRSLSAASDLMARRQMGIAAYRIQQDVRARRYELLPLDGLIPLTFSVRDLEEMVRLHTLSRPQAAWIQLQIAEATLALARERLAMPPPRAWVKLAFPGSRLPARATRSPRQSARRYVRAFAEQSDHVFSKLGNNVAEKMAQRIPAVLAEARKGTT